MASFIISSIFTFQKYTNLLHCINGLIFVISIVQEESSKCRLYVIFSSTLWILYDIVTGALTLIITHAFSLVSAIMGLIRLDRKK